MLHAWCSSSVVMKSLARLSPAAAAAVVIMRAAAAAAFLL
jgi:hypothetical protein